MIRVSTLREHLASNYGLSGYCRAHGGRVIDLHALIRSGYGDVHLGDIVRRNRGEFMPGVPRLTCSVCGVPLYEQGATRDEIARRFDSTPERITQLICYERSKRRPKMAKAYYGKPASERTPFNPSNCRRDVWLPLKGRAGVRNLDLYSLRHTFASMARAAGEFDFNVARALGQAKSKIVDTIYARTMASGLASISRNVTDRVLGAPAAPEPPQPPVTPTPTPPAAAAELAALAKRMQELLAAHVEPQAEQPPATTEAAPGRPQLSVIEGGKRSTRKTRENPPGESSSGTASA